MLGFAIAVDDQEVAVVAATVAGALGVEAAEAGQILGMSHGG